MKEAQCFISIELTEDLVVDKPIAETVRLLRKLADDISEFVEGEDLEETFVMRIGRKRAGQADLHVREPFNA